LLSLFVEPAGS